MNFFFCPSKFFFISPLWLNPIPRRFYRPHEINESRCGHGVRRVWCSDEKKKSNCSSSLRSHDMLHANIATGRGSGGSLLSLSPLPRHPGTWRGGWEHEPGMCMPSINVRRTCIKMIPRGCDWPMAPQSKPRGPKWLHVANLGQTSGVRPKPHTRTTLVAWDEPWPHLHTHSLGGGGGPMPLHRPSASSE